MIEVNLKWNEGQIIEIKVKISLLNLNEFFFDIFPPITNQNSYQLDEKLLAYIHKCATENDVRSIRKIADEHQDQIRFIFGPLYKLEYLFNFY